MQARPKYVKTECFRFKQAALSSLLILLIPTFVRSNTCTTGDGIHEDNPIVDSTPGGVTFTDGVGVSIGGSDVSTSNSGSTNANGGNTSSEPHDPTPAPDSSIFDSIVVSHDERVELGSETYSANILNYGIVSPGTFSSIGTAVVEGDFELKPDGVLSMEIAGLEPGEHDYVDALGGFTFEGTIRLIFTDGFAPCAGDVIPLVGYANSLSINDMEIRQTEAGSQVSKFDLKNLRSEISYGLSLVDNILGLTVHSNASFVPEPSSAQIIFLLSLVSAFCRYRDGNSRLHPQARSVSGRCANTASHVE